MNKALIESFAIHFSFLLIFLGFMVFNEEKVIETFNFDIVEKEVIKIKKSPKIVINADTSKPVPKKSQKEIREVFGVKRKTMTSEKGTVVAKIGNTLTKKEDDKNPSHFRV